MNALLMIFIVCVELVPFTLVMISASVVHIPKTEQERKSNTTISATKESHICIAK